MNWTVQLAGDASDLSMLSQSLTGSDIHISHDGQDYLLKSDRFDQSDDAAAVRQKAEEIVTLLNGASRLVLDAISSVRVGAVYRHRENGTCDIFVTPATDEMRFRDLSPTIRSTGADGTIEASYPADPVRQYLTLASSKTAVANVFRILSSGTLNWSDLYRIFEIIADDVGGLNRIAEYGWATKKSMRLFKHTADSPSALGLNARHGVESTLPPSKPMTMSEARTLVNSLIHAWLRASIRGL